ncbi:MAG: hypothetical protein NTX02_07890 [Planctomycetia bacterium]|nr:hypothetical protein [Planctomycetia bacterium]
MIAHRPGPLRVVVYEGAGSLPLEASMRTSLFAALLDRGYAVTRAGPASADQVEGATLVVLVAIASRSAMSLENRVTKRWSSWKEFVARLR